MWDILNKNVFFVKEHMGMFKAANNYDIYDPETNRIVLECREEKLGPLSKILRFSSYKNHTPFHIEIKIPGGPTIIHVKRGAAFLVSIVRVLDENEILIGSFKQKLFSFGGEFELMDAEGRSVCKLKGDWSAWDFRFLARDVEFAHISKTYEGIEKELLTSADNYVIEISDRVSENSITRKIILAAAVCIDMVMRE